MLCLLKIHLDNESLKACNDGHNDTSLSIIKPDEQRINTPRQHLKDSNFHVKQLSLPCQIAEACVLLLEEHLYGIGRAVAVLCNTELGDVRVLRILIVVVLTIEEHNDVRILFDGAGLTEIREHGALVRASLGRA